MATEDLPPQDVPPQELTRDEAPSAENMPDEPPERAVEESAAALTPDEKQWAMFCHLSALLGLLVGGLTFVGPLVCWLIKKDSSRFVDYNGKESLNFQINILIYVLISIPIAVITCGFGIVLTIGVLLYGIIMPIIAGLKANNGERYRYPYTFRIIK